MSEYVMVPRELTWGMMEAWTEEVRKGLFGDNGDNGKPHKEYMAEAYRAMITAAPAPQGIGREEIARVIASGIANQDCGEPGTPDTIRFDEGLRWHYIDQGEVDFGIIADAILALLPTEPPAQEPRS